jgi:hypothetical protein
MFSDLIYSPRAIFWHRSMETDLDEEVRLHVEREAEAFIERGVPPENARRRARLAARVASSAHRPGGRAAERIGDLMRVSNWRMR